MDTNLQMWRYNCSLGLALTMGNGYKFSNVTFQLLVGFGTDYGNALWKLICKFNQLVPD